ncbi:hypothetical protein Hhal_1281 [Halorhodospira halophila SL1]|uniref:Uncharacterized protein n=1 Tax=Halorhodospira halophila (strain DSM 244 / SL1) TaxID=349124 RepID=A1WWJ3_HALHL|nr:hypothetical protein Hhal_1281 [Halorhodospira halophila SL1]
MPTDGVMHSSPLGTRPKVGALAGLLLVRENASIAPLHLWRTVMACSADTLGSFSAKTAGPPGVDIAGRGSH